MQKVFLRLSRASQRQTELMQATTTITVAGMMRRAAAHATIIAAGSAVLARVAIPQRSWFMVVLLGAAGLQELHRFTAQRDILAHGVL